jgi:hypothetical protein
MRVKLAGAFIAALLVFGMVFGAGQAAAASLPGEPLYGLKLAAEQARVELTTDPEAKAELAAEMAENRLGEIAQMVASGKEVDGETAFAAQQQISLAFQAVNQVSGDEQLKFQARNRLENVIQSQHQVMANEVGASGQQQESVQALMRSMMRVRAELQTGENTGVVTGDRQYPELSEPAGQSGAGVQAGQQDGDGLLDGTGAQQGQAEGQGGMGVGPNYGPGTDDAGMGTFEGDGYGPGDEIGAGPAEPQNETEDPGPFGWLFQLFQNEPSSGNDSPGSGSSGSNSPGSGSSGSGSSGSGSQGGRR